MCVSINSRGKTLNSKTINNAAVKVNINHSSFSGDVTTEHNYISQLMTSVYTPLN